MRYELGLDLRNRVLAGRMHRFDILAGAHSGAPDRARVTELSVKFSTDGGETWTDARVSAKPTQRHREQHFTALVRLPKLKQTDGSVWLQVEAKDANGGTVKQTVERAYLLK